jgi:hypothetical protein
MCQFIQTAINLQPEFLAKSISAKREDDDSMTDYLTTSKPQTMDSFQFGDINLFEIDDAGTILYCRIDNQRQLREELPVSNGRNFFDETLMFENIEELRQKFKSFVKGQVPTENFEFTFRAKNENTLARVKFLRIVERVDSHSINSTFVDIRKSIC